MWTKESVTEILREGIVDIQFVKKRSEEHTSELQSH